MNRKTFIFWRIAQSAVWLVGAGILAALVFAPRFGIHAFWNVLIPVAPALLVVAPGVWRNVCPMGSTALLARHMNWSLAKRIPDEWRDRFGFAGLVALLLIIPLRHVVLDTNGPATALTIAALVAVAIMAGFLFEWKSGWCSGLCPVHHVEKLYGARPLVRVPNAHCHSCKQCAAPCPDSTPDMHPLIMSRTRLQCMTSTMMVGGFAGFIWGWFQVPDYVQGEGWQHLIQAYGMPFGGFAATLCLFVILRSWLGERHQTALVQALAAAAVSCYYWYRIPACFGFGPFPGDGMLLDAAGLLPAWFPTLSRVLSSAVFVWLLLVRGASGKSWVVRPEAAGAPSHTPAT